MKEWGELTLTSSFLLVLFEPPLPTPLHFSPPLGLLSTIVIAHVFRTIRPVGDDVVVAVPAAAAALLPVRETDHDVISSKIRADFFSFIALVLWAAGKEADDEDEDEDEEDDDDDEDDEEERPLFSLYDDELLEDVDEFDDLSENFFDD